jgi:hypothetical protein
MLKYISFIVAVYAVTESGAQVHVRDEPRHHNVFENEYLRILDVYLPPGDTTLYHLHNTPSVFVFFTSTTTASQLQGQSATRSISDANTAIFDSLVTPRIHRVWNEDSGWFHVMDVELTSKEVPSQQPLLQNPALQLLFNKSLVNAYKVQLNNKELHLPTSAKGYLLVSYGQAGLQYRFGKTSYQRLMKSGHYLWIDAGHPVNLSVKSEAPAGFLLLQMK